MVTLGYQAAQAQRVERPVGHTRKRLRAYFDCNKGGEHRGKADRH